uniref:Uncharacterized protein n=1 Tax=Picea sitchensis TaxID=3332 RepID=A0A6B9XWY0_PICSI|nr:hypothetical protein Q903MT_gene5827 [Picea sitchensis]
MIQYKCNKPNTVWALYLSSQCNKPVNNPTLLSDVPTRMRSPQGIPGSQFKDLSHQVKHHATLYYVGYSSIHSTQLRPAIPSLIGGVS